MTKVLKCLRNIINPYEFDIRFLKTLYYLLQFCALADYFLRTSAYCTSVHTSMGATSYSLVYGMEAVLPTEIEIPSLRILSQTELSEVEWACS